MESYQTEQTPVQNETEVISPEEPTKTSPQHKTAIAITVTVVFCLILALVAVVVYQRSRFIQAPVTEELNNNPTVTIQSPTSAPLLSYTNKLFGYSFQYPATLSITPGPSVTDISEADSLNILPASAGSNENAYLVFSIERPWENKTYASEKELISTGIRDYNASSTARYFSPESNKISELVKVGNHYQTEIAWKNDPQYSEGGSGTEVWVFYPLTSLQYPISAAQAANATFLMVSYPAEATSIAAPILNSLQFN